MISRPANLLQDFTLMASCRGLLIVSLLQALNLHKLKPAELSASILLAFTLTTSCPCELPANLLQAV